MTPEEYKEWLSNQLDYYAKKAEDAENCCEEDEMNHYAAKFEAVGEVFQKFNEVVFKEV